VYGTDDPFREPLQPGGSRRIGQILQAAGPLMEVRTVEGERAYRFVAEQDRIVEMVGEWLVRHGSAVPVSQG
jgi:hypothetical protein